MKRQTIGLFNTIIIFTVRLNDSLPAAHEQLPLAVRHRIQQWGEANLGDARRNARAIRLGVALAGQPQASLPNQTSSWAELKAAYRLLNEPDVTYAGLSTPHWQITRRQATQPGLNVVLFIQDTTELDFTAHRQTQGLGHIGDTNGRGFELHSCLAVIPTLGNPEIVRVAAQTVWTLLASA